MVFSILYIKIWYLHIFNEVKKEASAKLLFNYTELLWG